MSKGRSRSSSDYRGSRGRNLYDDLTNKKKEKEEMTTPIGKLIKKEHAIKRKLKPLREKHKGAKDSKTIIACELKIARLEQELSGVHKSMKVYREQKKLFNKLKQNE